MTGRTLTERLEAAKRREAQAAARRQALEARARTETRRADTRARCVLAGAALAVLRAEPEHRDRLAGVLMNRVDLRDRPLVAALLVRTLSTSAPAWVQRLAARTMTIEGGPDDGSR